MRFLTKAVPTLAALLVAAASFALSYVALRDVAVATAAVPAHLAWLTPVCVDGAVLAGSASLWASSARGGRKDPIAFLVVVVLLVVSVVININHAGPTPLAKVISALPPLTLLACLELVANTYRRDAAKDAANDAPVPAVVAPTVASVVEPVVEPVTVLVTEPVVAEPVAVPAVGAGTASVVEPAESVEAVPAVPAPPAQPGNATGEDAGPSKAAVVRAALDAHVAGGGDPHDPSLTRAIATANDLSIPYVRKVLGAARKDLATA